MQSQQLIVGSETLMYFVRTFFKEKNTYLLKYKKHLYKTKFFKIEKGIYVTSPPPPL